MNSCLHVRVASRAFPRRCELIYPDALTLLPRRSVQPDRDLKFLLPLFSRRMTRRRRSFPCVRCAPRLQSNFMADDPHYSQVRGSAPSPPGIPGGDSYCTFLLSVVALDVSPAALRRSSKLFLILPLSSTAPDPCSCMGLFALHCDHPLFFHLLTFLINWRQAMFLFDPKWVTCPQGTIPVVRSLENRFLDGH